MDTNWAIAEVGENEEVLGRFYNDGNHKNSLHSIGPLPYLAGSLAGSRFTQSIDIDDRYTPYAAFKIAGCRPAEFRVLLRELGLAVCDRADLPGFQSDDPFDPVRKQS